MAHRKWKEAKQLQGTAGPGNMLGCCLIYSHFLWAILPIRPVELRKRALFTDFQGPAKKGPSEMPPKVGEDLWQVGWSVSRHYCMGWRPSGKTRRARAPS